MSVQIVQASCCFAAVCILARARLANCTEAEEDSKPTEIRLAIVFGKNCTPAGAISIINFC
jgi:hypothetical protein